MINVDDRILGEADADELFLLLHIAKHMNKENFAWPSNATLCASTKWEIKKLQRIKARCIEKGFIEVVERYREIGGRTTNGYRVKTDCLTVFMNLKGKGGTQDRIPQNGIGGIPQNGIPRLSQNGIGAHTPKRGRERSINKNEVLTNERESESAHAQKAEPDFQPVEIQIDFEPLVPQTGADVQTLIAQSGVNGDNPTSRLQIWQIAEPYFSSREFQTQWKFLAAGILGAEQVDPVDVMREWITTGPYYDVKEFRYNKIKGWIRTAANTLKNGKQSSTDNEPRFGASTVANLDRAYRELLAEGFK